MKKRLRAGVTAPSCPSAAGSFAPRPQTFGGALDEIIRYLYGKPPQMFLLRSQANLAAYTGLWEEAPGYRLWSTTNTH